jgi:acyl carrier protein
MDGRRVGLRFTSASGLRFRRKRVSGLGRDPAGLREISRMAPTFDRVADIIAQTSDIPREKISPESHVIEDLGIDSLDFLDIVFAIDKDFGIKIPVEAWTEEVNAGKVPAEQYFVLRNLVAHIDQLATAKRA